MIVFIFLSMTASLCLALPNIYAVDPQNIVTVPPNCPPGQEWINGQCRDVWIAFSGKTTDYQTKAEFISDYVFENRNAVDAPSNCEPNQNWVNGKCRNVWRTSTDVNGMPHNMVTVPPNCPSGQEYTNGACRDIWRATGFQQQSVGAASDPIMESNLLKTLLNSVLYEDGDIGTSKNVINVPNQCPAGYKPDALGFCREIFD